MGWIVLEALVALLLAVFIVWFTIGGKRREPREPSSAPEKSDTDLGGA